MHRTSHATLIALLLLITAGCSADDAPADSGAGDAGRADAGGPDGGLREDAALPEDAAMPGDAAMPDDAAAPDDAAMPTDAGLVDAGNSDDAGGSADAGICPFGDIPVCAANVAGGTQSECTVTLVNFVTQCESAGWNWTGDSVCTVGGSPSSPTAFGGDGVCSR